MSEPLILCNIKINAETPTLEFINNKRVYVKRLDLGNLPNNGAKTIDPQLFENEEIVYFRSFAKHSTGSVADVASTLGQLLYTANDKMFTITTTTDRSEWQAYIDVYYIKN